MGLSCRQALLQKTAAQSVVRRVAVRGFRESANSSRRFFCFSSITSFEAKFLLPPSVSLRIIFAPDISAPALSALNIPILTLPNLFFALAAIPIDDLFWQFIQAYMKNCQNLVLVLVSLFTNLQKDTLDSVWKDKNLDLYYDKLHIEYYNFCQQYKDHFETAGAKGYKHVLFATLFLKDHIFYFWQQHKFRTEYNQATFLSQNEFKAFLKQSLGKSDTFISSILKKTREHFQH